MNPIFLAHGSKDIAPVEALAGSLESRGIPCVYTPRDVPSGEGYMDRLHQAVGNSHLVVACYFGPDDWATSVAVLIDAARALHKPIHFVRGQILCDTPALHRRRPYDGEYLYPEGINSLLEVIQQTEAACSAS